MTDIEWFKERFPTETSCMKFLVQCRWPDGFICPRCGSDLYYQISRRRLFECVECKHQHSITSGTIFHNTKLPLRYWFLIIYWFLSERGVSANKIAGTLQIHSRTAQRVLRFIRHAMGQSNGWLFDKVLNYVNEEVFEPTHQATSNRNSTQPKQSTSRSTSRFTSRFTSTSSSTPTSTSGAIPSSTETPTTRTRCIPIRVSFLDKSTTNAFLKSKPTHIITRAHQRFMDITVNNIKRKYHTLPSHKLRGYWDENYYFHINHSTDTPNNFYKFLDIGVRLRSHPDM